MGQLLAEARDISVERLANQAAPGESASAFSVVREGQAVVIRVNGGSDAGSQPRVNLIGGTNILISAAEDTVNSEIDVTISVSGIDPVATRKSNLSATAAPTANDDSGDGFSIGSLWIDVTNDQVYMATDVTPGAAVWKQLST